MSIQWPWKREGIGILMVCRANICRSPMAEAILRHKLELRGMAGRIQVASAGTHVAAGGAPPDPRVLAVLEKSGISLKPRRSRSIRSTDFEQQRFILAMDEENLAHLQKICPQSLQEKLHLVTSFSDPLPPEGIPDPYFGNPAGFERVRDLLDLALEGFLETALVAGDKELS